jgi:ATP-dependent DNA helicase RecG
MVELNMIDTVEYGIHSMNVDQARRYFPLLDYDLSELNAVKLTLYGVFLDPVFSNLLYKNKDLPLEKIIQLDKESKEKTRKQIQETREETGVKFETHLRDI